MGLVQGTEEATAQRRCQALLVHSYREQGGNCTVASFAVTVSYNLSTTYHKKQP